MSETARGHSMANEKSPAEVQLDAIVARGITPTLKDAGFRKTGRSYHRRHGETVQVVNLQLSHGSTAMEKEFFINVGIAFDAICELMGVPLLDRPKEYECDERGFRDRLELLLPASPDSWIVRAGEENAETLGSLHRLIPLLRAELDQVDGLAAYRSHRWFDRFRPTRLNAQVLYLLGDRDAAWREVQDLSALFSDRVNANRAEWWMERLRLTDLRTRVSERDT